MVACLIMGHPFPGSSSIWFKDSGCPAGLSVVLQIWPFFIFDSMACHRVGPQEGIFLVPLLYNQHTLDHIPPIDNLKIQNGTRERLF
jgi:hypothetical protein